jgi:alpha-L-rhamnosidase
MLNLLPLLIFGLSATFAKETEFICNLQVEGLGNPLAIPNPTPRFSWISNSNASYQLSYRILVQCTWPDNVLLWDSGRVSSSNSWLIPYEGEALPLNADFTWRVELELSGIGYVTDSSFFSTPPSLSFFDNAAWLGGADTMRTSFILSSGQAILRARFHVSAAGCYHAYINGRRISDELSPGFSHAPSARMPYDTYDVSSYLNIGVENVLGLRIGSCKFGTYGQYCKGTPSNCNVGLGKLEMILEDVSGTINTTTIVTSSNTWTAANTSIIYQHLYNGEVFDSRLEQDGWNSPGFLINWNNSNEVDTSDLLGPLEPSRMKPIIRGNPIIPASIKPVSSIAGSFVFDVGLFMNMAGYCTIDVRPPPGEQPVSAGVAVSLLHGEILFPNGTVDNYFINTGNCPVNCAAMNFTYITRGLPLGEFESAPHFSYFGFRFVQMFGWPYKSPPTASAVKCYFTHSDLLTSSAFALPNNPVLDNLQRSVVRTHLSNLMSIPTDCPQREKRAWSGDGQLTTHSAILNFEMLAFYENWHRSMLDQQRIGCLPPGETIRINSSSPIRPFNWACNKPDINNISLSDYQYGTISDVVPFEQQGMGYFTGDPSWQVAGVVVPYEMLTQLANLDYVEKNYDGPSALIKFFNILGNADDTSEGLIEWSYLGDWKALDIPDNKLVANSNYAMAALFMAEIASAIGNKVDSATYLALFSLLSTSMRKKWFNTITSNAWDKGSQSAQALCLQWGIGGNETLAPAVDALLSALNKANGHLTVGASGARVLLDVLHRVAGRPDLALSLAQTTDYPSWGYFISNSSFPGTFWEEWAFHADGNSDNHIFHAGGITAYITEAVLGLNFAMRPIQENTNEDNQCPCEEDLDLPFSASKRFGLSCDVVDVICEIVNVHSQREHLSKTHSLDSIRLGTQEAFARRGLNSKKVIGKGIEPRLSLSVSDTAARRVRLASGWRITPRGNVTWSWIYKNETLRAVADIPDPTIDVIVELPLTLFLNSSRIHVLVVVDDGLGNSSFVVNVQSLVMLSFTEQTSRVFESEVLSCGVGTAANNVEGRVNTSKFCFPAVLFRRRKNVGVQEGQERRSIFSIEYL